MSRRVIDDGRFSVQNEDKKQWNLKIDRVKSSDHGLYTCSVNIEPEPLLQSILLTVIGELTSQWTIEI